MGEEEQESVLPHKVDRLCSSYLFPRVLTKSANVLELLATSRKLTTPSSRVKSYPQGPHKTQVVPFSEALEQAFTTEWEHFHQSKHHNRHIDKFYTLPGHIMKKFKVALLDAPVVAVSSAMTLSSECKLGAKDS